MVDIKTLTPVEKEVIRIFIELQRDLDNSTFPFVLLGPADVSRQMEFSRPRAYAILSKLEEKGILEKMDRKGYFLTDAGQNMIRQLLHRSMVLETYFVDELGMDLADAEEEAQNVVLYVSDKFVDIVCERMGQPKTCPHDYPIPHKTE